MKAARGAGRSVQSVDADGREGPLAGWRLWLLIAPALVVSMAYGVTLPLLPDLLETLPGVSTADAARHTGWMTAAYTVGLFFFSPLWGALSDRIDRRAVIAWGLAGNGAALWAVDFAAALPWLYVARITAGVLAAAVLPAVFAYVVEASPPTQRQRRFAWIATTTALGFLLGPLTADALRGMTSRIGGVPPMADSPFALVAYLCVAAAIGVYGVPASRGLKMALAARGEDDAWRIWRSLVLTALVVLAITVGEVGLTLISRTSAVVPPAHIPAYFALCSVVMVSVQLWLYPRLERLLGEPRLVAICLAAMTFGVALLAWPQARWVPLAAFVLQGTAVGVLIPALAVRISVAAGARQGRALGRQTAAANLGQAAGAAATGVLYAWAPPIPFLLAALLMAMGGLAARGAKS